MMDHCSKANKNWHLQMVTNRFFAKEGQYNFRNPAWYVLKDNEYDSQEKSIHRNSYDVLRFMDETGGIANEIFGLNYIDIMKLDMPTYNRIKQATYDICEKRAKAQEESERLEAERIKAELAAQQRAAHNNK